MTDFRIERLPFDGGALSVWAQSDSRNNNWPVVYTIHGDREIYVGETLNAATRMSQHLTSAERQHLRRVQIIFNDTFNKSVCLDLESHLIRYFHADGKYQVLNKNYGLNDYDYFNREEYRKTFDELFAELHREGAFTRSIPEIENTDLFKFSPFKSLTSDQAIAVDGILEILFGDLSRHSGQSIVVQGDPGTGKTVVAVYLVKLLIDIATSRPGETLDQDAMFSDLFEEPQRSLLSRLRLGLVIPQQSLRKTLERVFAKTPSLSKSLIMSPFEVGKSDKPFDVLIVDEAHRLSQRANQPSAAQNRSFTDINLALFGDDSPHHTQLDWIRAQSAHQILLVDQAQSVKPADLPSSVVEELVANSRNQGRFFHLQSQLRVKAGKSYVDFIGSVLRGETLHRPDFGNYDFRIFDDLGEMRAEIFKRDSEVGLSRMVAGYAWPWRSKENPDLPDIEIDGQRLWWNRTATDWVNSPTALEEVGSIHTVQGYDLNYAGVIIGNDLGIDEELGRFVFRRDNYFDKKGKENNPRLGREYNDDDLLAYVKNIYRVLLTRGIRGTYVYVCDPALERVFRRVLGDS